MYIIHFVYSITYTVYIYIFFQNIVQQYDV